MKYGDNLSPRIQNILWGHHALTSMTGGQKDEISQDIVVMEVNRMAKQSQRTRLRRRIGTSRSKWWVQMLDVNFTCIFSKTQFELGLPEYDIDEIINKASDGQIGRMNCELDELQMNL